jgi:glycosyltransferase involved in cell wall biosynthesis
MMRVLHVIPSIDPARGGTVEALMQLVHASVESGQQHEILTLDEPASIASVTRGTTVHAVGPTQTFYGHTPRLDAWLQQHLPDYTCAVIHGCWQYHGLATFRACRRSGIPYFQYTHGMLDPWFKRTYPLKHLKKWLYWPWAEYRILKHARRVIFTCEEEKRLAAQSFWLYQVNPAVIPLGITPPTGNFADAVTSFHEKHPGLKGKRLLTFMSRIHEKKGVDLLIEACLRLQRSDEVTHATGNPPQWTVVIAGPCSQPAYLEALKSHARTLPAGGPIASIEWLPMVQGPEKWGLLASSEAFILPSHQENFGMVVAEALACGTPVLLSDKVNIWREVTDAGAGWVDTDSADGAERLLRRWMAADKATLQSMRSAAKRCYETTFIMEHNSQRLFDLLAAETHPS